MKVLSTLTLSTLALGCSLTGCSSASVEQRTWALESFASESVPVDSVQGMTSEFTLADGKVTSNAGVNSFKGTYELSGDDINFGPLASTKMAGPPEAMKRETRFLQGLESAAHVEVRNETMTLSNDNDVVLMLLIPAAKS